MAAVALLVLAVSLAAGGGGEASSTGFDDTSATSSGDRMTSTTQRRTTTSERATTTTTLPTIEGWFQPAVPADCDLSTVTLLAEARAAMECAESWQVVDLRTGEATAVAKGTSSTGLDLADAMVGESYLWWDVVDVPASGLDPPSRTFTLRSRPIAGGDVADLVVLQGDEYSEATITGAWGSRVLTYERLSQDGPSHQVLRDATGTELARFESSVSYGYSPLDGIVEAGEVVVDLTTAAVAPVDTGAIDEGFDPCAQAGVANAFTEPAVVRRGPDGLHVGAAVPGVAYGSQSVGAGDRIYGSGPSGGLAAYDLDGTLLWELSDEVARSWSVFGGVPFVANASDEVVAVDPATGQEGTVSAELLEAATVHMRSGEVRVDSATGDVLLFDHERGLRLVTLPECKVR